MISFHINKLGLFCITFYNKTWKYYPEGINFHFFVKEENRSWGFDEWGYYDGPLYELGFGRLLKVTF